MSHTWNDASCFAKVVVCNQPWLAALHKIGFAGKYHLFQITKYLHSHPAPRVAVNDFRQMGCAAARWLLSKDLSVALTVGKQSYR